ncbi:MAG: hypothetical protein N2652_08565 [Kiritimatiellae bacterium]|nr:hypothetical protein [Kiritimatiellia bacterium]
MTLVQTTAAEGVEPVRWQAWLVRGLALALLLLVVCRTTTHPAVWTDLAVGRAIVQGGIPRTDAFTFTSGGERWLDVQWLYHALLWLLWQGGGAAAVSGGVLAAVVAAMGVALWPEWRRGAPGALVSLALLVWLGAGRWHVQPWIAGIAPAAAVVLAARQESLRLRAAVSLLAQLVWINLDPSAVAAPLVALAGAAGDEWAYRRGERRGASPRDRVLRFALPLAMALVFLIQPYGAAGIAWVSRHRAQLFGPLAEEPCLPAVWLGVAGPPRMIAFYVSAGICAVGLAISRRPPPARESLLGAVGLLLGMLSWRWMPLLVIAAGPLLAWVVEDLMASFRRLQHGGSERARLSALAVAVPIAGTAAGMAVLQAVRVDPLSRWGLGLESRTMPVAAASAVAERLLPMRFYCSPVDGAWLGWAWPDQTVFADLRVGCRAAAQYDPKVWLRSREQVEREILNTWRLDVALLSCLQPSAVAMAGQWLADGRWQLIYFDGVSALLAMQGSETARRWGGDERLQQQGLDLLRREAMEVQTARLRGRRPPTPVRLLGAAAFYEATGRWRAAAAALELAAQARPNAGVLDLHLARARWKIGDREGARVALERFRRRDPQSELARALEEDMRQGTDRMAGTATPTNAPRLR